MDALQKIVSLRYKILNERKIFNPIIEGSNERRRKISIQR